MATTKSVSVLSNIDTTLSGTLEVQSNSSNLATQTTLSNIDTTLGGTLEVQSNSSNLATQTTLNDCLTSLQTLDNAVDTDKFRVIQDSTYTKFSNKYYDTNNPIFISRSKFGNFTSADTIYREPINHTSGVYDIVSPTKQLQISSSSSADISLSFYVEGISTTGTRISEFMVTDAIDSQNASATSTNTYINVTKFKKNGDFMNATSGDIYVYQTGLSLTAGVPGRYYSKISAGSNDYNGLIHQIHLIDNKDLYIHKIMFRKLAGIYNHRILFIRGTENNQLFNSATYTIEFSVLVDNSYIEMKDIIIPHTTSPSDGSTAGFIVRSNSTGADIAAEIEVDVHYSIIP